MVLCTCTLSKTHIHTTHEHNTPTQAFTGYFEFRNVVVKQEFFVVYRPKPPGLGSLYWCEPHRVVESEDCCLPLQQVCFDFLSMF